MDTSELYIKMCDCPEIQEQWDIDEGDFAFSHKHSNIYTADIDIMAMGNITHGDTWLPRQDQIQEMLKDLISKQIEYQDCCYCYVEMISRFASSPSCLLPIGTTMEQLWLAFYMSEKHQKFWGKEGWEDE